MAKIETITVWLISDGVEVVINKHDFDPAKYSIQKPRRKRNVKSS